MASNDLSLVVDFKAANLTQDGPSLIVSNSSGSEHRNFTLGQEGSTLSMRLRTTEDGTGLKQVLSAPAAITGERQVVAFVRSGEQSTLFVNGEQVATQTAPGNFSNWSPSFPLVPANEAGAERRWTGFD
ncbi:MAG: hypothetical protein ACI8W8_001709 [Rhodothermales bacterium]|jgi:hypothetical protein